MSDARKELSFGRDGCDLEQILRHMDLDQNPTDRLSDELIDLIDHADEQKFDSDRLDSILDALDQDNLGSDSDALDAQKALDRFYQRNQKTFAEGGESAATGSISSSSRLKRRLPRLLLIAAILVMLFATTAQAFHFNIFDLFARWTSDIFNFDTAPTEVARVTRNPLGENETRTYDSVEDMLNDFRITAPLFPMWIPERFEAKELYATNVSYGLRLYADYVANDSYLHVIANKVSSSNAKDIEKDSLTAEALTINNSRYYFISGQDYEKVIWQNGEFECLIYGTVTRDEMEQIISSIEKG